MNNDIKRLEEHTGLTWSGDDTGILCNGDPLSGGIIDSEILSGKWFVIFNREGLQSISGIESREEAVSAFINHTQK